MSLNQDPHKDDHEQNDNWEWSDSFTQFILDSIEGTSLKVCPGLRPICDVNLDIKNLNLVADSKNASFSVEDIPADDERAESLKNALTDDADPDTIYGTITADDSTDNSLYDGYACQGDMYDLPFEDNTFDTVVSDPPWLNLTASERRTLFDEIVRVTKPTGVILYNSTWIPETEHTNQYKLRFRQQLDFWGGPSFAAVYRRRSRNISELFDATDYESVERYPENSPFWSEDFNPEALSKDHNTDPKKLSGTGDNRSHCCPMCGSSRLGQLTDDAFENMDGQYPLYECLSCEYRAHKTEINNLAAELTAEADRQGCLVSELTSIDYTPSCIQTTLDKHDIANPLSADLPWVPSN